MSQLQESPAIYVRLSEPTSAMLTPLFWGMEEEGIPYKTLEFEHGSSLAEQAYQAAALSPLAVGIASDGKYVAVHSRNLAVETPLFRLALDVPNTAEALRVLGCNAARLVKGLAFKPL